jgi:hypothetical protein
MGIRRSLYKNEIVGYTNNCFLRNGNNYYHLLNSDFRDDNYNKQLKRTGSSNSAIRKNINNSFVEIKNATPRKSLPYKYEQNKTGLNNKKEIEKK